jgi:hypothetical protein
VLEHRLQRARHAGRSAPPVPFQSVSINVARALILKFAFQFMNAAPF